MEQKTMAATMAPTMIPENAHKDIPGNPSTAASSAVKLNDRSNGKSLRVLSVDDWNFWRNMIHRDQECCAKGTGIRHCKFLWEFEERIQSNTRYLVTTQPRAEMKMKELTNTGMVEVYNHQQLWNNRMTAKVYDAFVDIWEQKNYGSR